MFFVRAQLHLKAAAAERRMLFFHFKIQGNKVCVCGNLQLNDCGDSQMPKLKISFLKEASVESWLTFFSRTSTSTSKRLQHLL